MGKTKKVSDDQMSIQQEKPKKKFKKINKALIKSKTTQGRRVKSSSLNQVKIMKSFSKEVNAKKCQKTLHEKQQIFSKILQGLKDKSKLSKKERRKNRVLIKKQLHKSLQIERTRRMSEEIEEKMQQELPSQNIKKKTKKNIDEKKQIQNFKKFMGSGLDNLQKMVAFNVSHKH